MSLWKEHIKLYIISVSYFYNTDSEYKILSILFVQLRFPAERIFNKQGTKG